MTNVLYFVADGPDLIAVKKTARDGSLKHIDEIDSGGDVGRAVYDYTQYSENVKSGDLLYIDVGDEEPIVAILWGAWPTQLSGPAHPELHKLKHDRRYR